jgi:hypothetical protein
MIIIRIKRNQWKLMLMLVMNDPDKKLYYILEVNSQIINESYKQLRSSKTDNP